MKTCACPPRYTCSKWLRRLARSEALALRMLVRTHGRLPACQPLDKGNVA